MQHDAPVAALPAFSSFVPGQRKGGTQALHRPVGSAAGWDSLYLLHLQIFAMMSTSHYQGYRLWTFNVFGLMIVTVLGHVSPWRAALCMGC